MGGRGSASVSSLLYAAMSTRHQFKKTETGLVTIITSISGAIASEDIAKNCTPSGVPDIGSGILGSSQGAEVLPHTYKVGCLFSHLVLSPSLEPEQEDP